MLTRFDEHNKNAPVAERMTFSSFSHSIDDRWGCHLERPYRIVLLPGYRPPETLDLDHRDSLWVDGPVERSVTVWDGYDPVSLFEVIYECMRYEGPGDFIEVRDRNDTPLEDPRDPRFLRIRPKRRKGWGRIRTQNHLVEVALWAACLDGEGAMETGALYDEMVAHYSSEDTGMDNFVRSEQALRLGMNGTDHDSHEAATERNAASGRATPPAGPRRGPVFPETGPRAEADARFKWIFLSISDRQKMSTPPNEVLFGFDAPPESYYALRREWGDRRAAERAREWERMRAEHRARNPHLRDPGEAAAGRGRAPGRGGGVLRRLGQMLVGRNPF